MDAVKAKGRITGQVVSLDGTPIDGASVCFCPEDAPYNAVDQSQMPRTATDRRGCFILEPTAYYRLGYRLLVEERGSARSSIPLPIVFPNQTLELRTIVLSPGQVYHGRVTDLAGQPIRDAQIQISLALCRQCGPGPANSDRLGGVFCDAAPDVSGSDLATIHAFWVCRPYPKDSG